LKFYQLTFLQRLDQCDRPPSYFDVPDLMVRYPLADPDYVAVYNRTILAELQSRQVKDFYF
jgi:hypothetical protein